MFEPIDVWDKTKVQEVYSEYQINEAWKQYQSQSVVRVLRDGEWFVREMKPDWMQHVEGTRAEVVKVSRTMSFPKFLKRYYHE